MPLRYVARLPLQAAIAAAALAEQEERERERERERRAMRLAPSLAGAPHELLQQISLQALAHSSLTARVSSEGGEGEAVSGHHPSGHRLGGSRTGGLRRDLQPVLHSCMSHPNCAASDHVFAAVDSDASRRLAARRPRPAGERRCLRPSALSTHPTPPITPLTPTPIQQHATLLLLQLLQQGRFACCCA